MSSKSLTITTWHLGKLAGNGCLIFIEFGLSCFIFWSKVCKDLNMWERPGENFWLLIISIDIGQSNSAKYTSLQMIDKIYYARFFKISKVVS